MIDFPANPTIGQNFTAAGVTWTWDGAKWTGTVNSSGGGASISVGDVPPTNPKLGALWWDSVGGQLYLYYNDGNTIQWVPVTNQMGGAYLPLTGGFLTGALNLAADPVSALQPVTQQYFNKYPMIGDNRIINGDMRIDQRGVSTTGGAAIGYAIDRWQFGASQIGKLTWGNNSFFASAGPRGFPYFLGFVSTSAYASLATDYFRIAQIIEADMVSDFAWGAAGAQSVTLSFWATSGTTGTFSGSICNAAATRSYPFTFSLPTAATWTKIVLTIPGDTAGTWVMSGNAASLILAFDLGSGATYRGPANAWTATNYVGATGSVSIVATSGAYLFVTGVKLEIGSIATPFNRQSLAKSMADCLRYYQVVFGIAGGYNLGGSQIYNSLSYQFMRAVPSVTFVNIAYTNASGLGLGYSLNNSLYAVATITGTGAGTVTYFAILDAEL
jgi:hypothetical protein